jgi:hypothetical protein
MSNPLTCPSCAATFRPTADVRGKKLSCPTCGQPMVVTGAGVAKRGEGGPVSPLPARGGFPWGWLAAALLLGTAAVVALLATRRPEPKEEDKDKPVAAFRNGSGEAEGASDKLRRFVPGNTAEEPTPLPKPESPRVVAPEPAPMPSPKSTPPTVVPTTPSLPPARITYFFKDTLEAEEKDAPPLIATDPLGKNGFETAAVFGRTQRVYRFSGNADPTAQQAGLTFDNSSRLLANDNYSIEMVFVFFQKDNEWRRIVDVEDRSSDNGFYVDPGNRLDVYPCPGSGRLFTNGVFHHLVLTNARTGTVKAYMDGALEFTGATTVMNITNAKNVIHFFLDDFPSGWHNDFSNGQIALLRLYNRVLDDGQVSRLATALRGIPTAPPASPVAKDAAPDPGTLIGLQNQVGQTYHFRVTGSVTGSVWGTDLYTADSTLAVAAVHAGALRPGETGVVRVRMVAGLSAYTGSTRNGVASASWNAYPAAYTVSRAGGR